MKKTMIYVLIAIAMMFFGSPVFAGEYELHPRVLDLNPNDGFMDAGSPTNPYVIEDESGNEVGEIRSRTIDIDPHDGFMDPGTSSNPWVIETDDD